MTLGELIRALERRPPGRRCTYGFRTAHSYRGFYERVAFTPALGVTVDEMLVAARAAVGWTFSGWKGGNYTMGLDTIVHISNPGEVDDDSRDEESTYEGITPAQLAVLIGD